MLISSKVGVLYYDLPLKNQVLEEQNYSQLDQLMAATGEMHLELVEKKDIIFYLNNVSLVTW